MKTLAFLLPTCLLLFSCHSPKNRPLNIATAANMQFAMKALIEDFSLQTGIECEMVTSSSGKLTAQIKEGAPYDIFVAANMKYPKAIFDAGLAERPPQVYALGKLVLWSIKEKNYLDLTDYTWSTVSHIAVANPKTAPYGEAAIQALNHLGVYEDLENKLVFGESISQTNQFILSGAAELGFTAMSVVKSPPMKSKGTWIKVPDSLYQSIEQGVILIKQKEGNSENASKFYEFLFEKKAHEILKEYGYEIPA
ncbi:molybdate ABC transporter substrate-binding protein [Echinicola sp. CAU 1574]|uniref:Molybdate ABC transporter substrate-binding protein n=1 Tax=Echinicola arenosa TaxID=2774144 RepID=A0ABR9AJQ7_9BACT|nr:molybdate ABC transporter substrate-binding protein [Echinicola arenosa]MBD8489057.1 molybdate ABC transporter substrate-binding protein [Echinicola arenosa]